MSDIEFAVDTLDMLIAIETKLQDLIDKEDTMASDSIRDAQRGLERARRAMAKEEQELGISGYSTFWFQIFINLIRTFESYTRG